MIKIFSILCFCVLSTGLSLAGGNTSIVNLSEVHSVLIEENKITIIGSGFVIFRAMTSKEHQTGTGEVLGQPAQIVHIRATRAKFEIIPYANRPDIEGVPTGGHSNKELKDLSDQWWEEMLATYKKIKNGDSITISYQRDLATLSAYQVKNIIGSGGVKIHTESNKKHDKSEMATPRKPSD